MFAAGFGVGCLVHYLALPLRVATGADSILLLRVSGGVSIVLGTALALWGVAVFRRAHTTILPFRAPTAVVTTGPYRFSRNPMYAGMTLAYAGAALILNTSWPLLLLPIVLLAMVKLVITREEAFLAATFGADYVGYTHRVRRWL